MHVALSDTQVVECITLWGEKPMVLGIPLFGVKDNSGRAGPSDLVGCQTVLDSIAAM
jgi:hypothetical protein